VKTEKLGGVAGGEGVILCVCVCVCVRACVRACVRVCVFGLLFLGFAY